MTVGNSLGSPPRIDDLARKALERKDLSALVSVSNLISAQQDADAPSSLGDGLARSLVCVEAGSFSLAANISRQIYSGAESPSADIIEVIARASRRMRRVSKVATREPLVAATNSWIDGRLTAALNEIEIALLTRDTSIDIRLTKAMILADMGFLVQARKIVSALLELKTFPITELEIQALTIQIDLDLRRPVGSSYLAFKEKCSLPSSSVEILNLLDILELSIAIRMRRELSQVQVLSRIQQSSWSFPYLLATSKLTKSSSAPLGSLRSEVAALLIAARVEPRRQAQRVVRLAIETAEPVDLMSPFLEFGLTNKSMICEVASGMSSRFAARLVGLLSRPIPIEENRLNDRELLIMKLFAAGMTAQEIGRDLVISKETVKSYSHRALRKLSVPTRKAAIQVLKERGLLLD